MDYQEPLFFLLKLHATKGSKMKTRDYLQEALNDSSNYLLYLQWNKTK